MIQAVTVVPDGDGYLLGRRGSPDFVEVPEIGGKIVLWLQEGLSVDECAARAGTAVGEEVNIQEFLDDLTEAGVLTDEEPIADDGPPFGHRLGRILFGPVGLTAQAALVVTGLALLAVEPWLRPNYHDGVPFQVPLASLLTITLVSAVLTINHEMAHKLAAAQYGVYGRISFGRRLFFIVAQTDVTGLWALPRWKRVVPLAAGMLVDGTTISILLILQEFLGPDPIMRVAVFVKIGGIVAQTAVYMRTDFYALFLVLTNSKNLWELKGAVFRKLMRRAGPPDLELIEGATRRELVWARVYLLLYVPGVVIAFSYYFGLTLRATLQVIGLALAAIPTGVLPAIGGVVALLVILVPMGFGLTGAARSAVATIRRATHSGLRAQTEMPM
jgi:putative peptide zinc metalloprotease protein